VESKGGRDQGVSLNSPQIQQLRQSPAIDSLVAMDDWSLTLTGHDLPENVEAIYLTSNGFNFLGEPALLGRGLLPSDAVDGQEPQAVVVLGNKFWRRHFNSNPEVLGQTLQLDRKYYRIVGVAAPRFTWYSADVYLPLKLTQDPAPIYVVNFRLKPGESLDAADATLQPLMEQFARDTPKHFPEHFKVHVQKLNDWVVKQIGGTLYLLLGAVALLLAIGCGNVSILLLARGPPSGQAAAVSFVSCSPSRWCWPPPGRHSACWRPMEYSRVSACCFPAMPSRLRSPSESICLYSSSAWEWPC
jgi:hypothetical protein